MTGPLEAGLVACPQCSTPSPHLLTARDYNRRTDSSRFAYRRCPLCHLVFLWPVPADLSAWYPNEYYAVPKSLTAARDRAQPDRVKLDLVQRYAARGRLLEIGPAWGGFALLAKDAGFEVDVIERDASCCQFLRDVGGVEVHESDDPTSTLDGLASFRVIALWQVIEHLVDPWSTLEAIARRLEPGGILVVATPNPRAFQFRLLGRRWTHLDAPRHTGLIPFDLLREWGQRRSFRTLLLTTRDPGSLIWNAFGWRESLAGFFRSRTARAGAYRFGTVVARVMSPIDRREGLGCSYTIVLQRPGPGSPRVPDAVCAGLARL